MFEKWAKQYGPIVSVKLGTQTLIIINTEQGIRDLFEKRSANYSAKASNFGADFGENLNMLFRTSVSLSLRVLILNIGTAMMMYGGECGRCITYDLTLLQ